MATLSLCMIVKNEAENLPDLLSSAVKFADQIVIVDTGSEDDTVETAKRFTDEVYHFAWCDDFSAARNYAIGFSRCDFFMWLDADDRLTPSGVKKLRALKSRLDDWDVVMLPYQMGFDSDNHPTLVYDRERILRGNAAFRFQDPVHEVIVPRGRILRENIPIEHRKTRASDPDRNLRIYRGLLRAGKKLTPRQRFYYANELLEHALANQAAQQYTLFLGEKEIYYPDRVRASLSLAAIKSAEGGFAEAERILLSTLHHPQAEVLCRLGELALRDNRPKDAEFWYRAALNCKKNESDGFVRPDCFRFEPYLQLCLCAYQMGEVKQSFQWHCRAKKCKPNHPAVIRNDTFFQSVWGLH